MKRTGLVFILILMGPIVFAQNGVIRELSGTVELKASGSSSFVPARAGDRVNQDMVISTGFKSTALLEVGSAVITVRPLTRLTLTEIHASAGAETINVMLQAGRVRVDVNPPAGTRATMAVSSPIATASVRGTSFEFDTRNVHVREGQLSFLGDRGRAMPVAAGSSSQALGDGKAADPIAIKQESLRPKAPVGADKSGGSSSKASASPGEGIITIDLNYSSALGSL